MRRAIKAEMVASAIVLYIVYIDSPDQLLGNRHVYSTT
jgi:hypothetical protein